MCIRDRYHIVKQKDYLLSDGVHEAMISEEMWNQAHRKRQEMCIRDRYKRLMAYMKALQKLEQMESIVEEMCIRDSSLAISYSL